MRTYTKILSLLMALLLSFSLVACGSTGETASDRQQDAETSETTDSGIHPPVDDGTSAAPDTPAPTDAPEAEPELTAEPAVEEASAAPAPAEIEYLPEFDPKPAVSDAVRNAVAAIPNEQGLQILSVKRADTGNYIAPVVYTVKDASGATIYKTEKYEVSLNDNNVGNVVNVIPQGSFNAAYYIVSISNGKVVATPKDSVSDQNYTSQAIEEIKAGN